MADVTPIGTINFRDRSVVFGVKRDDRRRHVYVIGKTGSGKTTLVENMLIHDIVTGEGVGYLDPHGDSVKRILRYVPRERIKDVVCFDPSDLEYPIAFNPLENVPWEYRHLIASSIMSVFKKIWIDAWSARMEYILTNVLLALLEFKGSTLLDINRMLGEDIFRKNIVGQLRDPVVRAFWENEFARYNPNFRVEAIAPIQNKVGQFITNPLIRNLIGQPESKLDLRKVMDNKQIFLANLSKGQLGEESSLLLGGLLITKFQLAAMSRVDVPEEERKDFFLHIDEFQNFSTESFVSILSEARKYRLNLTLAHQYLDQVVEEIINAVFGNVGTMVVFKVGSLDGERFEKEFITVLNNDFVNLPKYHAYVKLLVDGITSRPFLTVTHPNPPEPTQTYGSEIIDYSRLHYGQHRAIVDARIARMYQGIEASGQEAARCTNCNQEFFRERRGTETLCPSCKGFQGTKGGISLKSVAGGGLVSGIRKEKPIEPKVEVDHLAELLRQLKEE